MTFRLFKVDAQPKRIAASGTDTFVLGGVFFLDFSRPLILRRYLHVGPVSGAFVPVIHEGEREGSYLVPIDRENAYFEDVRELWRQRYPSRSPPPGHFARKQDILAHFVAQFSSRAPRRSAEGAGRPGA